VRSADFPVGAPIAARALLPQPSLDPRHRDGDEALRAYTVEQVAELLQVGRDKVYQLLRTGQLHSIKIGNSRRITNHQLSDFVTNLEGGAPHD
jgi:excisionase family DNA binding protein